MHIRQGQFHWHNAHFPKPAKTSDGVLQRNSHFIGNVRGLGRFSMQIPARSVHVFRRLFLKLEAAHFSAGDVLTPLNSGTLLTCPSPGSSAQALPMAVLLLLAVGTVCMEHIMDTGLMPAWCLTASWNISACGAYGASELHQHSSGLLWDRHETPAPCWQEGPSQHFHVASTPPSIHPSLPRTPPAPLTDSCVFFNRLLNCDYVLPTAGIVPQQTEIFSMC